VSGTKEGGKKTRDKNLARDPDFYRKIGAKGGKISRTGGFAYANKYLDESAPGHPHQAGRKGGRISKKPKEATTTNLS